MKILVDKLPKSGDECLFGKNGPQFAGKRYCDLDGHMHYCDDPKYCPYLQPLATEVTWTSNVVLTGDAESIKKGVEEAVNMALKRKGGDLSEPSKQN